MKQKLLFSTFLLFLFCGYVNAVLPSENCLLIDHLTEVNGEWATKNLTDAFLFEPYEFENDRDRIQKHLALVTYFLNQENASDLTNNQLVNRQNQLIELTKYWKAKQFPINTQHAHRQPYFMDDFGTACAVGHLVLESGGRDLAKQISKEMNYAYLRDMPYLELGNWAIENGFSAEELAWIQPTYPPSSRIFEQLGNNGGIVGKVNVMKANSTDDLLYFAGDFTEIDGIAANDIIAYDGENWQLIPNEIEGEILDMTFDADGNLLVVGDFQMVGLENAVLYDVSTQTWSGVGVQAMDGFIKTVEFWQDKIFIGGEFTNINGVGVQNLAYTEYDLFNWKNSVEIMENGELITVENAFGVNGIVNDFSLHGDSLYIGGNFSLTAPNANTGQKAVVNVAKWSDNAWTSAYESEFPVTTIHKQDLWFVSAGNTDGYDGEDLSTGYCLKSFEQYDTVLISVGQPLTAFGFAEYNTGLFLYGDFYYEPISPFFSMSYSTNLLGFGMDFEINAPVTAAVEFQDKLYLAGEFTEASGFPVNNLAWTELEFGMFNSTDDIITQSGNIYTADNQLYIKDFPVSKSTQLSLYNLQGQLVEALILEAGSSNFQYSLAHLNNGAFVYYLETKEGQYSGKVVKF